MHRASIKVFCLTFKLLLSNQVTGENVLLNYVCLCVPAERVSMFTFMICNWAFAVIMLNINYVYYIH